MPLTPEEKKQKVLAAGLDPSQYTFVESPEFDPSSVFNPVDNTPSPIAPVSGGESFFNSLKRSLIPSAATLAGMRAGGMLPTVPHPIFGPIIKGAEILGGGLAASMGTGYGQEKVLQQIQGPEAYSKGVERLEAGRQQHSVSSAFGELVPMAPFLGSGGVINELGKIFQPSTISKAKLLQAAAGAVLSGGVEGGREYLQGEDISLPRIAAYGGVGGLLQNIPTKLGQKVLGPYFRPPELPPVEVINAPAKVRPNFEDVQNPTITGDNLVDPNVEALKAELRNKEITPSLVTDKDTPEIQKGEPANRPSVEEGYINDPTEKFYQEGEEAINRKVPAPGLTRTLPNGLEASEPIISFHDEGDIRNRLDKIHIQKGKMFVKEGPQYDVEGRRTLQEGENEQRQNRNVEDVKSSEEQRYTTSPGSESPSYSDNQDQRIPIKKLDKLSPEQLNKANELAQKRGVTLQQEPGIISHKTKTEARGYALSDEQLARINPNTATSDTGIHEVGHNYLYNLRRSTNPRDVEFYNRGVKAAGSEENLAEAMGRRGVDIQNRPLRTWLEDAANYTGSKIGLTKENTANALARRLMDDRPFSESPEFKNSVKEFNKYYSEVNPKESTTREGKGTSFTTGPFKSTIDRITEQSPIAANAAEATERETNRLNGTITNSFVEHASKIKEGEKVMRYVWESNNKETPTVILNPKDKALIDGPINETYKLAHEEQRADGPLINGRAAISKENRRGPNTISRNVLDTLLHKPSTSVERQKLIRDFEEFEIKKGIASNVAEAKEHFNSFLAGHSAAAKGETAAFNALRKAEGEGIPWSWMEKDPVKAFRTYGNRVARDLAYWRNIENNPEVSALFGHTKMPGVEPVTGPAIKTAQKRLTGQHTTSEVTYNAVEHFVRSIFLGPATGIKNTVDTLAQILPYTPVRDLPKVLQAFGRIKQGYIDSMKMGVNRHSITSLETGDVTGVGRAAENLRGLGDIIRKYTGANAIEQWTRAHNMALGEILTESNWGLAAKGDIEARKFLRMFAPEGESLDFRNLSKLDDSVKLETAARFVERVQGTYGLRGLPSFLLEPTSPVYWFMSLSKWSVEKANVITKDVINPALTNGDYGPLLRYTLGGLLTGQAIRSITEELFNRKTNTPDIKEILDKGKTSDYVYKAFELSGLASLGGLISDVPKLVGDVSKGYNNKGYTIVSAELTKDLVTEIGNASQAIQEGQKPLDVVLNLALNMLTDNIQAVKMVSNNLKSEDMERSDKFRDKRIYDKLDGKNVPPPQGRTDRYGSMAEREFKRAKTVEEGKKVLDEDIKPKLEGLPKEEKKKEVASLKKNSYQTVPADKKEAEKYYQYIRRTQGVDAMVRLRKDKTEQDKVNREKSRLFR